MIIAIAYAIICVGGGAVLGILGAVAMMLLEGKDLR